jgi:long-chain fatty acid transport protein
VRAGCSRNDQPVPESGVLFNILAPALVEKHFTLGPTRRIGGNRELDLTAMYAPNADMDCGCTLPMTGEPESINIGFRQ